jgi:hypothetical protein
VDVRVASQLQPLVGANAGSPTKRSHSDARAEAPMRKSMAGRDDGAVKGAGHRFEKHEKAEGWVDLATLGFIVALGLVMVVGLLTASGSVTW